MHVVPLPGGEFQATHLAVQAYATTLLDHMGAGMLIILQYVGEGHVALGTTAIDGNAARILHVTSNLRQLEECLNLLCHWRMQHNQVHGQIFATFQLRCTAVYGTLEALLRQLMTLEHMVQQVLVFTTFQ